MQDLLRSVWEEPRPPGARPPMWRDWMLVGLLVTVVVLEGIFRADVPWRAISVALAIGLPTLLWRRSRPLLMVALAFGASALASLP